MSATSALVVTRSAISAVVATDFVFGLTIAGASWGCASSLSVIDGVALGDGAGDDDALAKGCGVCMGDDALGFGLGVETGTFKWMMQL